MLRFNICALEFILYLTNSHRAVFNWVSKRILDCFSFALFRSVIGLENSHLSLNQSNADISSWSVAFSRASTRLHVFDFSLDRDNVDLFFWLVVVITLVMLVDNHWSLFYFIVCYMPQKVSQRNAKRYLNSLWLSPSLKPVDQVLSKLSLKKNSMLCYSQWLVLSENPPKQIVRKIPGTVATTPLSHLIPGSTIRMIFSVFLYQTWTASSLPYVVTLMMLILGGQIADYLRKHHLATGTVRKIFNTIGKWLSRYIKKIAKTDLREEIKLNFSSRTKSERGHLTIIGGIWSDRTL